MVTIPRSQTSRRLPANGNLSRSGLGTTGQVGAAIEAAAGGVITDSGKACEIDLRRAQAWHQGTP